MLSLIYTTKTSTIILMLATIELFSHLLKETIIVIIYAILLLELKGIHVKSELKIATIEVTL
jgi:hypothetical protein